MSRTTPEPNTNHRIDRAIESLALIGDRWTIIVMHYLRHETVLRYGELEAAITDISRGVLTRTLRSMERDGLVERKVYPVLPPRVEYTLTELGLSLIEPIIALCEWSEANYDLVKAARNAYDDANGAKT